MAIDRKFAIGYVRVSTQEQAEGGYGIEIQMDAINSYCKTHRLKLIRICSDPGASGALKHRPGLMELFDAMSEAEKTVVVIHRLDRLARDLLIQENLIADIQATGASLISIDEPDLLDSDPTRKLFRQIKGAIAEYERALITLRLHSGRLRKARDGGYAGGAPAYGYDAYQGSLLLNEGEADVVRYIRKLRNKRIFGERMSYATIADHLNIKGVPTKRGGHWHAESVKRVVIKNVYRGKIAYGGVQAIDPSLKI